MRDRTNNIHDIIYDMAFDIDYYVVLLDTRMKNRYMIKDVANMVVHDLDRIRE